VLGDVQVEVEVPDGEHGDDGERTLRVVGDLREKGLGDVERLRFFRGAFRLLGAESPDGKEDEEKADARRAD